MSESERRLSPESKRVPTVVALEAEVATLRRMKCAVHALKASLAEKEKALANVPAGMRVMPEDEREATLAILRANRADVEAKLAALPIATGQTQTSLRRKAELETRLAEIEDAQRVFQRRVVLVRDE